MKRGLLFLIRWLAGCAAAPPPGVTPVTGFGLDRYLGRWYEIARLDHPVECGCFMAIINEHYPTWREARTEINELPLSAALWKSS